jgi:hypothetical protein
MSEASAYDVDRLPAVDDQIKELGNRARAAGILREFVDSMKLVLRERRHAPFTWGDPVYNTKKEGGVVCRGIEGLVVVQYVVYEENHLVCILSIDPLAAAWPS